MTRAARVALPAAGRAAVVRDYLSLTKPRVVSLLLLTTLAAMLTAADGPLPQATVLLTMLGGYLAAGGAGAINCYVDRDIDTLMGRTSRRPIPAGRIAPRRALAFGLALTALATLVLAVGVNPLAAAMALAGGACYVGVYTLWLKRRSPHNIVIGGAAGAFPPLVGWAAATGAIHPLALVMFAIIFVWTPPHFWALALIRRNDYARAGVPMLPVARGDRATRGQIYGYALGLAALSLLPVALGWLGWLYAAAALLLGGRFVRDAAQLRREVGAPAAWRLYRFSLIYLALLFSAMPLDRALAALA